MMTKILIKNYTTNIHQYDIAVVSTGSEKRNDDISLVFYSSNFKHSFISAKDIKQLKNFNDEMINNPSCCISQFKFFKIISLIRHQNYFTLFPYRHISIAMLEITHK